MIGVGDTFPDFEGESNLGPFKLYDYIKKSWVIIFCSPGALVPVPSTELAEASYLKEEFSRRNIKVFCLVCSDLGQINTWLEDVQAISDETVDFPVVADPDFDFSLLLGTVVGEDCGHAAPSTARTLFVVNPQKKVEFTQTCPVSTGYSFHEVLRVITAMQAIGSKPHIELGTPANWIPGKEVFCLEPSEEIQKADAKRIQVVDVPSEEKYIQILDGKDLIQN